MPKKQFEYLTKDIACVRVSQDVKEVLDITGFGDILTIE